MARLVVFGVGLVALGIAVGGYLFSDTQPRSFLAITDCRERCYAPSELAGLLAAAGISRASDVLPLVARETDRCVAIRHPFAAREQYVIFPKKDVRDIADVSEAAAPEVLDCLAVIRAIVTERGLRNYRVTTS